MNRSFFIDTHTHLQGDDFLKDREQIIRSMKELGIYCIIVGTNTEDSQKAIHLVRAQSDMMRAVVGIHPTYAQDILPQDLVDIEELMNLCEVVGIGETGMDLLRDSSLANKEKQEDLFRWHIEKAIQYTRPVVVHVRNAFEEVETILQTYPSTLRVILHCFTGTKEWVERFLELPQKVYFSYSGIVTFKKRVEEIQQAFLATPLDRILTETDSPYLSPEPFRSKKNDSTKIITIFDFLATLKGVSQEDLIEHVWKNAQNVFGQLI